MSAAIIICIFAYFMGAIPTGFWIGKLLKGIDIRKEGSCSTGATNVLRCVGKGPAVFVLIFDMFKGALPVLVAIAASDPANARSMPLPGWLCILGADGKMGSPFEVSFANYYVLPAIAAMIALIGHSKSIFLGMGGGKSAATGLGALTAMNPIAGACMFTVFVSTIYAKKWVSLGSIAAAASGPFFMHYFTHGLRPSFVIFNIMGSSYVIIRHRANIGRLLKGTEPKIGQKAKEEKEQIGDASSSDDPGKKPEHIVVEKTYDSVAEPKSSSVELNNASATSKDLVAENKTSGEGSSSAGGNSEVQDEQVISIDTSINATEKIDRN